MLATRTLDRGPRLVAADSPLLPLAIRGLSPPALAACLRVGGVGPGVVGPAVETQLPADVRGIRGRPVLADQGRSVGGERPVGLMLEEQLGDTGPGKA